MVACAPTCLRTSTPAAGDKPPGRRPRTPLFPIKFITASATRPRRRAPTSGSPQGPPPVAWTAPDRVSSARRVPVLFGSHVSAHPACPCRTVGGDPPRHPRRVVSAPVPIHPGRAVTRPGSITSRQMAAPRGPTPASPASRSLLERRGAWRPARAGPLPHRPMPTGSYRAAS